MTFHVGFIPISTGLHRRRHLARSAKMARARPDTFLFMKQHFAAAPWPRGLKAVSALVTLLLAAAGVAAYRAAPASPGFTHSFGLAVALVFPAAIFFSLLFVVSGYVLDGPDLLVARLFWSTRIPLSGLRQVFAGPTVCKGSWRIFGNGGLFSFTGLYRSKALGMYRLFATDLSRAVVLVLPRRTIVVTPGSPEDFVRSVRIAFPAARAGETSVEEMTGRAL